ncbi:phospho-N-acetylmuramoyl-pentapeptide-transferase, partial [Rhizobium sp. CRIBSB]|nr:phospho-N-acetylmuramoyl-pentapeptide-transferase [Rhizobium sp. CRIBSB]
MFYLLYLYYADIAQDYPLLNLIQYQTVRVALAMVTAMVVAVAMGSRFINWMRTKQGKGQPIRSDGPVTHLSKVGTPTMGGLMILAGIAVAVFLWGDLTNPYIWIITGVTAAFGVLGFVDDYAKVTKQTSAGLTSKQKLAAQIVVSVIAGILTVLWMTQSPTSPGLETSIAFPFFKAVLLNIGWFYVAFAAFTIVGFSNAVNLTDGLDGLAIVPVMMAAAAFGVISYLAGNFIFSDYLGIHHVPGSGELAIFCAAMIGGGAGFLWYNAPPAKIFMGDTGSLALGGALGSVAVMTKHELV